MAKTIKLVLLVGALLAGPSRAAPPTVLIFGDSLSAAYGITIAQAWPALLQARLERAGYPHRVVNASVTGETTAGGLARLPAALEEHRPAVLVIELGGNDGLRGLPPVHVRKNLAAMIEMAQKQKVKVLLVGIRLPPNYGPAYTEQFYAVYPGLAKRYDTPLVPFLLDGVATRRELMQDDGVHPRAEAQAQMLENVWPYLEPMLKKARAQLSPVQSATFETSSRLVTPAWTFCAPLMRSGRMPSATA